MCCVLEEQASSLEQPPHQVASGEARSARDQDLYKGPWLLNTAAPVFEQVSLFWKLINVLGRKVKSFPVLFVCIELLKFSLQSFE